ncbi:MAG: hypothetical protein J0L95_04975 [Candidatus Accumulibacter sp.]|nr:hypothetical protein [Accumulibacter sp.]
MIGSRSRYSLAQFLELHERDLVVALVSKHGISLSFEEKSLLAELTGCVRSASDEKLLSLVEEIARTAGDLRARVIPKYRHDERFSDLCRCLQLDGYIVEGKNLTQADPSISDAPALDDDLLQELKSSGLFDADEIAERINASSESFRSSPPNYNACLNDIRVALETLVRAIAATRQSADSPSYEQTKWGSVIAFLKAVRFITQEEEKGLAGVYGFVSPGSHRPVGLSEEQMTRLGRSLALGMCWFLVKSYRATP